MATAFNLTRTDVFPNGTSVSAYPTSRWNQPLVDPGDTAPLGSAVESQTITSDAGAFVALAATATRYFFCAQVGGIYRYVRGQSA